MSCAKCGGLVLERTERLGLTQYVESIRECINCSHTSYGQPGRIPEAIPPDGRGHQVGWRSAARPAEMEE